MVRYQSVRHGISTVVEQEKQMMTTEQDIVCVLCSVVFLK